MRKFVLALAAAASVLTGCEFQSQEATQPNVIGPLVRVEASSCPGGSIDLPSARRARASAEECVTPPGSSSWQQLAGYLVPAAATAPDTVELDGAWDVTLQRSESYEDALEQLDPAPDGLRWVGYAATGLISTPVGEFTVTADFNAAVVDALAQGPFRYRVVSGHRVQPEDLNAPISCVELAGDEPPGPDAAICLNSVLPEGEALAELPVRDLKVLAGETQPVEAGGTAQVPFTLHYVGPASPDADFAIAATSTVPGVQPLLDTTSVAPPSDSDTPLAVSLTVPGGTAPGDYDVTLTASLPNGQERTATGRVSVVAPAGVVPPATTPPALLLGDPPHAVIIRIAQARLRGRTLFTGFVVRCPAALPVNCGGSGRAFGGRAAARTAQRRRSSLIGKSGLAVPSGAERELRVRLTPRGVRFLRDRRRVELQLGATIRGRGGARVTTHRDAVLRLSTGG